MKRYEISEIKDGDLNDCTMVSSTNNHDELTTITKAAPDGYYRIVYDTIKRRYVFGV